MSIVILHGWGSSSQSWQKVKELLEVRGFRVFVPDLPGFCDTPPPSSAWGLDEYAQWVKTYADQQGLDRFFLLGHSFGGRIANKFALQYPERLWGLILVASAGVTPRKKWKIAIFRVITKIGDRIFSPPPIRFLREIVRKIVYFLAQERDYYKSGGIMRQIMKKALDEDLKPVLTGVQTPTLIVWGTDDKMTPIRDAHVFHDNIKRSKLVVFEGGKHGLNLQMPDKLANTVVEWIGSFLNLKF